MRIGLEFGNVYSLGISRMKREGEEEKEEKE